IVQTISARALGATFDDMPGNNACSKLVPLVFFPAELVSQWCHRQRCVGRPPRYYDIRSSSKSLDDRYGSDVSISRQHTIAYRRQRVSSLHVGERMPRIDQLVQSVEQVIARHYCDAKIF